MPSAGSVSLNGVEITARPAYLLARALVFHPSVVLLDEPLGTLDLKLRKAMQLELKTLQREIGITFVYVTHDQEEALTMSDRSPRGPRTGPGRAIRADLRQPALIRRRLHRRLELPSRPGAGGGVEATIGPTVRGGPRGGWRSSPSAGGDHRRRPERMRPAAAPVEATVDRRGQERAA
jgi:hypothetical protein